MSRGTFRRRESLAQEAERHAQFWGGSEVCLCSIEEQASGHRAECHLYGQTGRQLPHDAHLGAIADNPPHVCAGNIVGVREDGTQVARCRECLND